MRSTPRCTRAPSRPAWASATSPSRRTAGPAAQVEQIRDVIAHPQLDARKRWRRIDTERAEVDALLPPATFDDHEARMGAVPALGQHTGALLREVGYDDAAIDAALASRLAHQNHSRGS